ncbi:MAG: hypothetical protein EZS28_006297 [Streblomastix strix]|uniref:Uncharacterized protein n=1 Tax=Streblomastix strix TaxID=222440 RepID=A0A5J4WSZ9_9EUKA|nr:MAG: hypothetical protein EZS28_006297 [Streblomastix strix]
MGFFSGIANFGSKIFCGVKKAAQWVAPALHKVLSTISGSVGMIHLEIGGALGAGANLAGAVDRLKRGNSSGGMISNEDAESGTVWMYDAAWYNSGDILPDQVTPASSATPLSDGKATAGISTEYSRVDHVHPLNITTTIPFSDSASGSVGSTNYYARSNHSNPLNITTLLPPQDSTSGSVGITNYYARNDHSHPINVETNTSNIPIVNEVGNNGSSAYYSRQDHIHPQQLTYYGNITATKFIKTAGTDNDLLLADGTTKKVALASKLYQVIEQSLAFQSDVTDILTTDAQSAFPTGYSTTSYDEGLRIARSGENSDNSSIQLGCIRAYNTGLTEGQWAIFTPPNTAIINPYGLVIAVASQVKKTFAGVDSGNKQINPIASNYDDCLRISRTVESIGGSAIFLGCNRTSNTGVIAGQWQIFSPPSNYVNSPLGFVISLAFDSSDTTRGLRICADGNTLTFNVQVIAGIGANNGAIDGSVNYSAGNNNIYGQHQSLLIPPRYLQPQSPRQMTFTTKALSSM